VAEDAHAALVVLGAGEAVDVLVSDVVMPGVNGLELRDRALALRPDLPVLFVSGYAEAALCSRGLDVSAIPLLTKPFRPAELVDRVRGMVSALRR
jgi:CheY-like chemotaxis protein